MVYLLCFDKKFKHAKHYIGFAENQRTFEARMKHHSKGSGSRLMAAIAKVGIGFCVARTWPDGDRNFERKLKNRKKSSELCPHCSAIKKANKMRDRHIAHIKANPPSPKMQAMINELSTPEGFRAAFDVVKDHEPVVCPVVETAKRLDVDKTLIEAEATHEEMFRCKFFDKKPEVANAQPESPACVGRWARIRSRLAGLWLALKGKLLSK